MDADSVLHRVLAERAGGEPEAPAVLAGERVFTHGELLGAARSVARRLAARGVGRGEPVGVLLEPSVGLVVALVGTLHAGAAHVWAHPHRDSREPAGALTRRLAATGVNWVITDRRSAGLHPSLAADPFRLLRLDEADEAAMGPHLHLQLTAADAACVLLAGGEAAEPAVAWSHGELCRRAGEVAALSFGSAAAGSGPVDWPAAEDLAAGGVLLWATLAAGGAVSVTGG